MNCFTFITKFFNCSSSRKSSSSKMCRKDYTTSSSTATAAIIAPASSSSIPLATSNPRVVVTKHAEDGTSVFGPDTEVPLFHPFGPTLSSFAVFDTRASIPVDNTSTPLAFAPAIPRCPPSGVIFCITNIAANFTVPMHRTLSLDYAVVLSGEIVLKLDGGEETTVKAGEFIIQGGANHQWINRTGEVCRIAFVMVGAEKVVLKNGEVLEETVIKRP